ncbi:conserved hypothetical protein [Talaromyces stipitatus ATCC 10500]|uniref:Uncharacterized protein n=1 Tax=Talaromyces stipitatus (strain ATCC 10500 / CBS 375.48 / QM 6759 / NRRL 1006) TaxID=441959 RepID=B8MNL4_TALSN|nr:uncharacterized protein TSTA_103270 [Talaromyces stipitatus ATCC 10500]EED14103.1 conserved hypothetical protein [Talaromyces stipitatus ATCC 10500]
MACFIQLRDNVPSWISEVNKLSAHVHTKRAEFAAEAENVIVSPSSLHRKKSISSSVTSVRSQRSVKHTGGHGLKRLLSRESLRSNEGVKKQRIMNNDESTKAEPTAPVPPSRRGKPTQVISYDGHTQKVLEAMVRDIWMAKSSIRSSRISASMRTAFGGRIKMQIPLKKSPETGIPDITSDTQANIEVDPDASTATDDDGLEDQLQLRMYMMKQRSRRSLAPPYTPRQQQPTRTKESPYDFIESQLENAQNLCETAAYKFLREGNCLDELDSILRAYELILEASTTMAEQEEERLKVEEEQEPSQEFTTMTTDELKRPAVAVTAATKELPDNDPEEMNAAILEVDDRSDTSEVSIDISAFRMTRTKIDILRITQRIGKVFH